MKADARLILGSQSTVATCHTPAGRLPLLAVRLTVSYLPGRSK